MSPSRATASIPNKLLIDPYAKRLAGQLIAGATLHFGYRVGTTREDLSFDRRDNARGMPKAVVVDAGLTPGATRRSRWSRGKTRSSTRRMSRA